MQKCYSTFRMAVLTHLQAIRSYNKAMANEAEIEAFWQSYLLTLPLNERAQTYLEAESWGNAPELADRIAKLILSGTKTTTSSLLWSQQKEQWILEKPGDKCIVLDSR